MARRNQPVRDVGDGVDTAIDAGVSGVDDVAEGGK